MDSASFRTLFSYNAWANARVLAAASQLSLEQFVAPAGLSHGSVRGTLVHVLGTEWMWRQRYQMGVSPPALPDETAYATLAAIACCSVAPRPHKTNRIAPLGAAGVNCNSMFGGTVFG